MNRISLIRSMMRNIKNPAFLKKPLSCLSVDAFAEEMSELCDFIITVFKRITLIDAVGFLSNKIKTGRRRYMCFSSAP